MSELVRPYRGISAADRQAQRRAQLIEACLDVVGRDGVAATTVNAVCEQAGLTKRYFYESFKDREALLEEVLEGLHTSLLEEIRERLTGVGEAQLDRARVTIDRLVAAMDDPRMARLYIEASAHAQLQARRQAAYDVYADLVLRDVLGIAKPDAADRLAALVFVTGTTQAVITWLQRGIDLERDELVEQLAAMAVAGRP